MTISNFNSMIEQVNKNAIKPSVSWVLKQAKSTGAEDLAKTVAKYHGALPGFGKETLNSAGGLYLMNLGFNGVKLSYDEGPDLQFAKIVLKSCSLVESELNGLKGFHTEFDQARSEYEKIIATLGGVNASPKPEVAEEKMDMTRGNFERELGNLKQTIQKMQSQIVNANTNRGVSLEFKVGTKELDIFNYWGEIHDGISTWLDGAEKMCKSNYKSLEFRTPISLVSQEDGGKGHVLATALKRFREANSSKERGAPIQSSALRAVVRTGAVLTGATGAYLFAQNGVIGLGGRGIDLCKAMLRNT